MAMTLILTVCPSITHKNFTSLLIGQTAEDNPANDYPDDELSSADEYDDNPSIYRRYRTANSDDEEFDVNEFDEGADDADYRKHMYDYIGDDDDDD